MVGKFVLVLAALTMLQLRIANSKDPEVDAGPQPGASSAEIAAVINDLKNKLKVPNAIAFSPADVKGWAEKARKAHSELKGENGDPDVKYDVVIQAGHFPRKKGATGGQGAHVNEQQMSAWVGQMLYEDLKARGYKVLLIDADNYQKGLKPRIFLALHTDSSALPCKLGPSVGYDSTSDAKGMHGIALALALTMGVDPTAFMRDSYTKGLKSYYAFKHFEVSDFEGVLEMAELSCPKQEQRLLSRADALSQNLAVGVVFALKEPFQ